MISANIGITYKCNLNCKHCYATEERSRLSRAEKDTAWWKNIIDFLSEKGCIYLTYAFGESFLRDDFFEIVQYAHQKGFFQTLMSNGSFTGVFADEILKNGINNVFLSLDYFDSAKHDQNRGKLGSYHEVINSAKKLVEKGVRCGFAFTYSDHNYEDIQKIIELAIDMNLNSVSLMRCRNCNSTENFIYQTSIFIVNTIKSYSSKIRITTHDVLLDKYILEDGMNDFEKDFYISMNECKKYSQENIVITPDGQIKGCVFDGKSGFKAETVLDIENYISLLPNSFANIEKCVFVSIRKEGS